MIKSENKQSPPPVSCLPLCHVYGFPLCFCCLTGQSKNAGRQEVEALVILENNLKDSQERVRWLEKQLTKDATLVPDIIELDIELKDARGSCARLEASIRRKCAVLGVGQRTALQRIHNNVFLQHRVNARAVKTRIRDRLRQRKFELEPLERSYRQVVNGM